MGASRRWRIAAGLGVLALLSIVGVELIPPYYQNLEFQRYVDDAVDRAQVPDALVADVVNKAARMGLPVHEADVHVTRAGNGLRVEIIYVVRVELGLYSVDLHFHPAASAAGG